MKQVLSVILAMLLMLSMAVCALADGETEISFITWRSEDTDAFKALIADFEAQNPDIKVNLEVTSADETEYYTVLKSRLISGEGADVMNVHAGAHLIELLNADYLLDLEGTGLADTLLPEFLDAGVIDGRIYGVPTTYTSFAIYYNEALFEELGIEPLNGEYSNLLAAAQKSREAGYMPVAAGFGDIWPAEILHENMFVSYGKDDLLVMNKLCTGEARITEEPYVSIFKDIMTMYNDGVFQDSATGTGYDAAMSLFASGKATMLLDGTWSVASIKSMNPDIHFGISAIPAIGTDTLASISIGQLICINPKSDKQEAALRFAKYLISVEGETAYCNATIQPSTVAGVTLALPELDMVTEMLAKGSEICCTFKLENSKVESIIDDLCGRLMAGGDLDAELAVTQAELDALAE